MNQTANFSVINTHWVYSHRWRSLGEALNSGIATDYSLYEID
jgi:hypothetical protein